MFSNLTFSFGIKQKFIALALTLLLAVSAFIAWFFPLRQREEMSAYLNQKASVLAQVISYGATSGVVFDDADAVDKALKGLHDVSDVDFAFVFRADGSKIAEIKGRNNAAYATEIDELGSAVVKAKTQQFREFEDITLVVSPIYVDAEAKTEIAGMLALALTRTYLKRDAQKSFHLSLLVSASILIIGGFVFFQQTARLVRPVEKLKGAAEQISENNFRVEEIPIASNDEIGALTGIFNKMASNLHEYVQKIERQSAQIALANRQLQENNLELSEANEEIQRQIEIQVEQSRKIELANSELQEKNLALDKTLGELKLAQTQLVQSERMNAAGMLTAGVMHEVNNPNAAVIAAIGDVQATVAKMHEFFFSLLDEKSKQSKKAQQFTDLRDDALETLNIAMTGARRVKGIVANLQNYTKHQRAGEYESELAKELVSTVEIFRYQFKTMQVDIEIDDALTTRGNFGELNQVFLNLLVNAAQAKATVIRIVGQKLESGVVKLEISDNGKGMTEDIQGRIFEPFFSTKGQGNSGLGLSISKQILDKHKISVTVESKPEHGATFSLLFPSHFPSQQ